MKLFLLSLALTISCLCVAHAATVPNNTEVVAGDPIPAVVEPAVVDMYHVPVEPLEEEPFIETEVVEPEPEPIVINQTEAIHIAKTVWGEAGGCSPTEQAAVIWCILNRVDCDIPYIPNDIIGVITQPEQFHGYNPEHPVQTDIYDLTVDVLTRWELEKAGEIDVGRVLPKEFLWFHGDGAHNYFRDSFKSNNIWDWSLESPYEQ